jgi:hypothetical protein
MTTYIVGPGGSDAAAGTSYALRKLTIGGAVSVATSAGDIVYVAPGRYAETVTLGSSGGSAYTTGTVSLTNGSATVTGSGTAFTTSSNVLANDHFKVDALASGTDGVTNGDNTFTSAAGNFQAAMVGQPIRINTKGAYVIASVVSATSITITDVAGSLSSFPSSGTGLTYSVGNEPAYTVTSPDSGTQLTLSRAWEGPTVTGVAYQAWRPIRFIADVTGANTDGVGGVVRVTGAGSNDQSVSRANCFTATSKNGISLTGFMCDSTSGSLINFATACSRWVIEECDIYGAPGAAVTIAGTGTSNTIRRCIVHGGVGSPLISFSNGSAVDNTGQCVVNCVLEGDPNSGGIGTTRIGGILVRNCTIRGNTYGVVTLTAPTTGQATRVENCVIAYNVTGIFSGTPNDMQEDYNCVFGNTTARSASIVVGAHSVAYPPVFEPMTLYGNGRYEGGRPYGLLCAASGQKSAVADIGGVNLPATDLYGLARPQGVSASFGAVEGAYLPTRNDNSGDSEYALPGRGIMDVEIPVADNTAITITATVRWTDNTNIGSKPQMLLLADYGVSQQTATATGTGTEETLTIGPITPQVPNDINGVMILRLVNRTTYTSDVAVYFDDISVS